MRAVLTYAILFGISTFGLKAQDKYLLIRAVPDNFTGKVDSNMPNRLIYHKDNLANIQCFVIKADTIDSGLYDKLKIINQSVDNDSTSVKFSLMIPIKSNVGDKGLRIEQFNMFNPWGFRQIEKSTDSCMTSGMFDVIGLYERPTNELSIIDYKFIIRNLTTNNEFGVTTHIRIEKYSL